MLQQMTNLQMQLDSRPRGHISPELARYGKKVKPAVKIRIKSPEPKILEAPSGLRYFGQFESSITVNTQGATLY